MTLCRHCHQPIARTTLPPDAPGGWTRGPQDPAGHFHEPLAAELAALERRIERGTVTVPDVDAIAAAHRIARSLADR